MTSSFYVRIHILSREVPLLSLNEFVEFAYDNNPW